MADLFENRILYINRLQRSEWLQLFTAAGFELVEDGSWYRDLGQLKLAERFRGMGQHTWNPGQRECCARSAHRKHFGSEVARARCDARFPKSVEAKDADAISKQNYRTDAGARLLPRRAPERSRCGEMLTKDEARRIAATSQSSRSCFGTSD